MPLEGDPAPLNAIVNTMVAARDMRGNAGFAVEAIEHNALVALLKRYDRYDSP